MSGRRALLAGLVGIAAMVAVWELVVRLFDIREFILLAPSKVVGKLADDPGLWLDRTLVTARHALVGLAAALLIGILVGSVMAASRFLEHAVQPLLTLILVAPWVAYFTSLVIWLGSGDRPVYFLVGLVAMPAFGFATVSGMRSADPAARELLRTVRASRAEVLWRLRLPSALPAIFGAARYATGLALAAAYYGEGGNNSVRAGSGLGTVGRAAIGSSDGRMLWASVFATVALGVALLLCIAIVERLALRWHVSQRRGTAPTLRWRTDRLG